MTRLRMMMAMLFLAAVSAQAQYPARGAPDPSFNGGRPLVLANTPDASNYTSGFSIEPLSGTRFAVVGVRAGSSTDAVMIVDTVPERVTTFDALASPSVQQGRVFALATLGSAVLVGGYVVDGNNKQFAALELREVGVAAVPVFQLRAGIQTASTDAAFPAPLTTAVFAKPAEVGGRVWQVRTRYSKDYSCSNAALQRLDYNGLSFTELHQVDLSAGLTQPCLFPTLMLATPSRPGDPEGADALVIGGVCSDFSGDSGYACFTRLIDTGSSFIIDRGYGKNGIARFYGATQDDVLRLHDMKVDAVGNVFAASFRRSGAGDYAAIAFKLNASGALDTAFGSNGSVLIAAGGGYGAVANGVALTPGGVVQMVGNSSGATGARPYIAYLDATSGASQLVRLEFTALEPNYAVAEFLGVTALPGGGALAVGSVQPTQNSPQPLIARLAGDQQTIDVLEYYNAGFDHYFVASVPEEIRKLDDGTFVGWKRTGAGFAVLPLGTAGAADVCRFFSTKFGERSSHFYTPLTSECEGLKQGDTWGFEGLVFALQDLAPGGGCAAGTQPLFRLYNDGMGGAPNHRYTVNEALRAAQVAQGWTGEGSGSPPVFSCTPR